MKQLKKRIFSAVLALAVIIAQLVIAPSVSHARALVHVNYMANVQSLGWMDWVSDGEMAGTSARALRLEGIRVSTSLDPEDLGVQYTTHVQNYGWMAWSCDGEQNGAIGESKRLEAIKIQLTGSLKNDYDIFYRLHVQNLGWLGWTKNGAPAGSAGYAYRVEGIQIVILPAGQTPTLTYQGVTGTNQSAYVYKTGSSTVSVPGADSPVISYRTHVQNDGWQTWRTNGAMSGTSGRALRLEGINIDISNTNYDGDIVYRTHVQNIGWQDWKKNGDMSGTSGKAYRLEGIQIYLTGSLGEHYDVYYRVHAQNYGWLNWAKNGAPAGTAGYALRLEGIQIVLVAKNASAPTDVAGIHSTVASAFVRSSGSSMPDNPSESSATSMDAADYSYTVIPLLEPFNEYFYILTENPDPDSFYFVDPSSVYTDGEASITPMQTIFSDVTYENEATYRVPGGYIASGICTDGGVLELYTRTLISSTPVLNITTGETTYRKNYSTATASKTIKIAELVDEVDYLIDTYSGDKTDFFERLTAIQSGLQSICLYSGTYVLGDLVKSTTSPYWGLSTSPHKDQDLYLQDPYSRKGSKPMLVSYLYPFRYDSLGFPSTMGTVAKRLDSTVTTAWNSNYHYLMDITYNGTTKSYGGAGSGGGQGILPSQIKYIYTFDKSSDDAYLKTTLTELAAMNCEYGTLTIPDDREDFITWGDIRKQVGEGSYAQVVGLTSIYGGSTNVYTYLYDNGSSDNSSSLQCYGALGYFSNAWYDGRYFNSWEYFYPGATLAQTVEDVQPVLIFKDRTIKYPDDDKDYRYNYAKISNLDNYDTATGVWSGYTIYRYNAEQNAWIADIYSRSKYYDSTQRKYLAIEDEAFIDACTITMDEATNVELIDRNTNVAPSEYLRYTMDVAPGTKGTN
ncbi:MAG: hypothetical protein K6F92_01555 [Lachnospiraceae bacterium]|nr:hypothetical protein [Lachnospiraceae bacterium]